MRRRGGKPFLNCISVMLFLSVFILERFTNCTYLRLRRRWSEETLITFNLPVGLRPGFVPGFFLPFATGQGRPFLHPGKGRCAPPLS